MLEKTLTPVYPLTANIRQKQLQKWINIALETLQKSSLEDNFSSLLSAEMPTFKQALAILHHPNIKSIDENIEQIISCKHPAAQRLIIEELCAQQLSLLRLKRLRKTKKANVFQRKKKLAEQLLASLNFTLTNAQNRSLEDISQDLSSGEIRDLETAKIAIQSS
ncbi:MAG: hypothetical protein HAW60_02145, partial [Bdellovibrionales bacterium]|nr:hypothetical protein [Bdellovibrionales bacterium]